MRPLRAMGFNHRAAGLLAALAVLAGAPLARAHDGAHDAEHEAGHHAAAKGAPADAPRSFARKPAPGTWAKCPVSGELFKVVKRTAMVEHQGRWYAFCCPDCIDDFKADPAKYAEAAAPARDGQ